MDVKLDEILSFRKAVSMINEELKSRGILEIEYMLINESIPYVFSILEDYSIYYQKMKEYEYRNGSRFCGLLGYYFECVKRKYNKMFISDKKTVDKYFQFTLGKNKNGPKSIKLEQDIGMDCLEVQRTLSLMKEAVYTYYRFYHKKILNASLNPREHQFPDIEFQIKESELAHLLGISYKKLRNNPDFIRLMGEEKKSSIELLEWILRDIDGNCDLVQHNEDFIKRMEEREFQIIESQYSSATETSLFNYHKIAMKSQTFMHIGPLEQLSLVVRLAPKMHISNKTRSDTIVIGKSGFENYPCAVLGSVQKRFEDKYTETLSILEDKKKKEILKGASYARVDGIQDIRDDIALISPEEQFDMFYKAYETASESSNYERLKAYFESLYENDAEPFIKIK